MITTFTFVLGACIGGVIGRLWVSRSPASLASDTAILHAAAQAAALALLLPNAPEAVKLKFPLAHPNAPYRTILSRILAIHADIACALCPCAANALSHNRQYVCRCIRLGLRGNGSHKCTDPPRRRRMFWAFSNARPAASTRWLS
jgi:hypothetical protein